MLNQQAVLDWFLRETGPAPDWFLRQTASHPLHPTAIAAVARVADTTIWEGTPFGSWHGTRKPVCLAIVHGWPHVPEDGDAKGVAYTPSEEYGVRDRVIKTKATRYLRKMLPVDMFPDHALDKFLGVKDKYAILRDRKMVEAMESEEMHGSCRSCMTSAEGWDAGIHPYAVYTSELGWGLAVRYDNDGNPVSRALINDKDEKIFVRLYGPSRAKGEYASGDAPELRGWLEGQGFAKATDWRGYKIKAIPYQDDGFIIPYIDRPSCGYQMLSQEGDCLIICAGGELDGATTGGYATLGSGKVLTSGGDWIDVDDAVTDAFGHICHRDDCVYSERDDEYILEYDCISYEYRDKRGTWHEDYTYPGGRETVEAWDGAVIDIHNAVEMANGDWIRGDDENVVEIDGEYYRRDDPNVVVDYDGEYQLLEECVQLTAGEHECGWAPKGEVCRLSDGSVCLLGEREAFEPQTGEVTPC